MHMQSCSNIPKPSLLICSSRPLDRHIRRARWQKLRCSAHRRNHQAQSDGGRHGRQGRGSRATVRSSKTASHDGIDKLIEETTTFMYLIVLKACTSNLTSNLCGAILVSVETCVLLCLLDSFLSRAAPLTGT